MASKRWIGSTTPSHYPVLGMVLTWGDVVDVPPAVLKNDPDSWGDPEPVKGKAPASDGEDEG